MEMLFTWKWHTEPIGSAQGANTEAAHRGLIQRQRTGG